MLTIVGNFLKKYLKVKVSILLESKELSACRSPIWSLRHLSILDPKSWKYERKDAYKYLKWITLKIEGCTRSATIRKSRGQIYFLVKKRNDKIFWVP